MSLSHSPYRCTFKMKVSIKPVNKDTIKNDGTVATHPCSITMENQHNHSTSAAAALKELRVLPTVKQNFTDCFEQGMYSCSSF